jgi:hypothetical protein
VSVTNFARGVKPAHDCLTYTHQACLDEYTTGGDSSVYACVCGCCMRRVRIERHVPLTQPTLVGSRKCRFRGMQNSHGSAVGAGVSDGKSVDASGKDRV